MNDKYLYNISKARSDTVHMNCVRKIDRTQINNTHSLHFNFADCDIEEGDTEILIDYGEEYWEEPNDYDI